MTVNEIISTIKSNIKQSIEDRTLTDRFIYYTAWSTAKTLMKRDADQTRKIYNISNIWQNVNLEMIEVSTIEDILDCNLDIEIDCTIYRSKDKLPKLVETSFGWLYKSITSIDGSESFVLVNQRDFNLKRKIKYNKDKYVFIHNDYLYTNVEWDIIKVSGIFENLIFCSPCEKAYDKYFPIPSYLEEAVITMSLQKVFEALRIPGDNLVNKDESNKLI